MQERHSVVIWPENGGWHGNGCACCPSTCGKSWRKKTRSPNPPNYSDRCFARPPPPACSVWRWRLTVEQNGGPNSWVPNFVWLAISSTLGAWAVLTAGKFWEAEAGDSTGRRFTMALCGMAVGCISYGLANGLLFQPAYILPDLQVLDVDELSPKLHDPYGMPRLAGFVVFFGILFGALRWWRQSDPTRRFRLSMVATALSVLAAIALQAVCPLPQAFLIAAATTIAVQISSPWMTRQERNELREELIAQEVGDEHAPDILA